LSPFFFLLLFVFIFFSALTDVENEKEQE